MVLPSFHDFSFPGRRQGGPTSPPKTKKKRKIRIAQAEITLPRVQLVTRKHRQVMNITDSLDRKFKDWPPELIGGDWY
jgi:hypothetical protein